MACYRRYEERRMRRNTPSLEQKGRKISVSVLFIILAVFLSRIAAAVSVEVTVAGVEGTLRENVLAHLSVENQKNHPDLTPALLRRLHQEATGEIRRALQPFGYYRPDIQTDLQGSDGAWRAVYTIDPGRPVLIEALDLTISGDGVSDERFRKLSADFPVRKGEILNHTVYEQGKRSLHDTAMKYGYLDAMSTVSRVEVHPDTYTASVTIHFDTGPQYRFGDVLFIDNNLDCGFLARYIPFRRGDPYHLSDLMMFQKVLTDSDYFESVEINPATEKAAAREVPIEVKLVPLKKNKYTLGVGYGTDTGFRGGIGWELRRVNMRGHRFRTDLNVSEIRSGLTAEYTVPLQRVRTDSIVYSSGWVKEDTDASRSDRLFGGVRYSHIRYGLKEALYVTFEQEEFKVGSDSGRSTLLIPGISWTLISAVNPITTQQGGRLYLDVRGAHDTLLSDTSFLQLHMKAKYIRGLSRWGRLIVRGEAGTSLVSDFSELPPSVRFFAGGDHSVRGYGYNSLGPEDAGGNVIGGKHILVGSIEYEQRIRGKWSAAVFYDIGNAVDAFDDPLMSGAGFGVRWSSPVGPVRVDLAFPLDETDRSWRLHVSIGADL